MKCNIELIRTILVYTDSQDTVYSIDDQFDLSAMSNDFGLEDMKRCAGYLVKRGYLNGEGYSQASGSAGWGIIGLTRGGQEFTEAIEDDATWERIKQVATSKGIPVTIRFINNYLENTANIIMGDMVVGDKVMGDKIAHI